MVGTLPAVEASVVVEMCMCESPGSVGLCQQSKHVMEFVWMVNRFGWLGLCQQSKKVVIVEMCKCESPGSVGLCQQSKHIVESVQVVS